MSPRKATKKESSQVKPMKLDDLIDLAQENIQRNERRAEQLRALVRFFESRKQAGEACPVR